MNGKPAELDEFGYPILYDVSAFKTLEGVVGAPYGTILTKSNGRRFTVTDALPLDPEYVIEHLRQVRLSKMAAYARSVRNSHE